MANELLIKQAPAVLTLGNLDTDDIWNMRVDMAAVLRMSARYGYNEGIDNHYSALLPGRNDLFIVNPYGHAFQEITASSLLICDLDGNVVSGEGKPEASAFWIHARLHSLKPHIRAALHFHAPDSTALCALAGQPFDWSFQTSLKFYQRIAVDEHYNGLALDAGEGDRIANALGDAEIVFLRHHGVMVGGASIADAWDDLYYIERAAAVQVKIYSTGRPSIRIPHELALKVCREEREAAPASARLHLDSVKRVLDRIDPDYSK
ncbi:aldolase [Pseudomonas putida]|uniref:aldolase n=1 Tax=Pseudomonas putida TaxID=303 RepID=UPI00300EC3B4